MHGTDYISPFGVLLMVLNHRSVVSSSLVMLLEGATNSIPLLLTRSMPRHELSSYI